MIDDKYYYPTKKELAEYNNLCNEIDLLINNNSVSTEDMDKLLEYSKKVAKFTGKGSKIIATKIAKLSKSMSVVLYRKFLQSIKSYKRLINIWEKELFHNSTNIDEDKFIFSVVNVTNKNILELRIETALHISEMIDDVKSIVFNSSKEEITNNMKSLNDSLEKKIFLSVEDPDNTGRYDEQRENKSIRSHGYNISDLDDILKRIYRLEKYIHPKYLEKIEKTFIELSEKITNDSESNEKQNEIRVERLLYILKYVKILSILSNDIIKDTTTLCEIAIKCKTRS